MAVMTKQDNRAEISMLLPWYAAGTLSSAETRRVAAAIERDPELAKRLEDIRDEAAETLLINESIAAPSRRVADKLFASIDAEQAKNPRVYKPKVTLAGWLTEKMSVAHPRTLAFAAAAAVAVIALQAGMIAGNFAEPKSGYQTAAAPAAVSEGPQILMSFVPDAKVSDIETLLKDAGGTIIEGPHAGGLYRVRIGSDLDQAGIDRVVQMLRDKPEIVRFVAPAS
jgi:anti-sigma factor RsiW